MIGKGATDAAILAAFPDRSAATLRGIISRERRGRGGECRESFFVPARTREALAREAEARGRSSGGQLMRGLLAVIIDKGLVADIIERGRA